MKKILLFLFLSIIIINFSQIKIKKENILLIQNSNSWIMNEIVDEFESKLSYSYNVYKEDKNEDYNLKIVFSEDASKNNVRILASFDGTVLDLSEKIKDNEEWVKKFTIKVLEKISFNRFFYSKQWNFLQLTYWDGVDEYPSMSPDGNKIIFISDRYIGNRNIWGYDFMENKYISIPLNFSSEYFPNITEDGSFVFQSSLYGKWDVLIYNPELESIKRISDDSYNAYTPYYHKGNIYFSAEERNGKSWTEIYKYNIIEDNIEKITSLKDTFKFRPVVFKNKIIFQMINPTNGQNNIYMLEKNKIIPLIFSDQNEVDPYVYKNYIVYSKLEKGYYKISLYDIKNKKEFCLTSDIYDDAFYPYAYNNIVLFSLYYKNGEPDIFAVRLP
ncbi:MULTISPECIES: TolB family protein [unclassified Marinitoga]|uniref:TolB family protein n=1 Tax=unclassified Marinitoga TaxID=2640159 RepID=UPI00064179FF|nr:MULTISPECIES: PD40 domain-containing protein [unclassified Marinitoga]KLO25161.1 hypothetical protein X274_00610 [Marinitoga sp. 1155]NUU98675.1 hypothetical protein [Marinitoga sp. 1154]